ncbi:hypothetical protein [Streptomyces avermitilis]|uniref:hypothetical protein n=1 Tax=Streptomyces avermitilis TaxID=33903 RepID=UPI003F4CE3D7
MRPPTFFPPSQPDVERGMFAAARTDCESTIAALGSTVRPSFSRTVDPTAGHGTRRAEEAASWRSCAARENAKVA